MSVANFSHVRVGQNPIKEIRRLAEFLEVDPNVADTVAEKTKFSAMQDFKSKTDIPEIAELFSDKRANAHVFRKGKNGCLNDILIKMSMHCDGGGKI